MVGFDLINIYFKENKNFIGFIIVVFETSDGIYQLDNCKIKKLDNISDDFVLYKKQNFEFFESDSKLIKKLLYNDEMNFIIILENNKVIIVSPDNDFNNDFNQVLDVFNLDDLSLEYLDDLHNYNQLSEEI